MSTRGTLHYWLDGRVHIYHECTDDRVYVSLFDRWVIRLPRNLFMGG